MYRLITYITAKLCIYLQGKSSRKILRGNHHEFIMDVQRISLNTYKYTGAVPFRGVVVTVTVVVLANVVVVTAVVLATVVVVTVTVVLATVVVVTITVVLATVVVVTVTVVVLATVVVVTVTVVVLATVVVVTVTVVLAAVAPPRECLLTPEGYEYKGHVNITKTGRTCQTWALLTVQLIQP